MLSRFHFDRFPSGLCFLYSDLVTVLTVLGTVGRQDLTGYGVRDLSIGGFLVIWARGFGLAEAVVS